MAGAGDLDVGDVLETGVTVLLREDAGLQAIEIAFARQQHEPRCPSQLMQP